MYTLCDEFGSLHGVQFSSEFEWEVGDRERERNKICKIEKNVRRRRSRQTHTRTEDYNNLQQNTFRTYKHWRWSGGRRATKSNWDYLWWHTLPFGSPYIRRTNDATTRRHFLFGRVVVVATAAAAAVVVRALVNFHEYFQTMKNISVHKF